MRKFGQNPQRLNLDARIRLRSTTDSQRADSDRLRNAFTNAQIRIESATVSFNDENRLEPTTCFVNAKMRLESATVLGMRKFG